MDEQQRARPPSSRTVTAHPPEAPKELAASLAIAAFRAAPFL